MKFTCELHKDLIVSDLGVRFKDGVYETTDKAEIEGLKKISFIDYDKPKRTKKEE